MGRNSPRSTGRASTSGQRKSNMNRGPQDKTRHNFSIENTEAQSNDDSTMQKKLGQRFDYLEVESLKEEEVEAGRHESCSCASSSLVAPPVSIVPLSTTASKYTSITLPLCMTPHNSRQSKDITTLQDDSIQPPVTTATLQELDLHSIQNNLNLRIDICYDPELFFQPISGRKGDAKRTEAKKYWSLLVTEFQIYSHEAQPTCSTCQRRKSDTRFAFKPRLPAFFNNLRAIVQMLVPVSDHEEVANHLDTDLLMQQVRVGVLDAVGLTVWLTNLLTSHCAPMRDRSAAAVTEQVRKGIEMGDIEVFVDGLEMLFTLLEAMKLDIANHQIRSFRYPLIEGAMDFQRDCFAKAIDTDQIEISSSQRWYRNQCFDHRNHCGMDQGNEESQRFACLIHGLVQLCNPYEKSLPLTFQYDQSRIMRLQEDLQDHIQMKMCLDVFNQQVQEIVGLQCDPASMHDELRRRIISLTEDDEGNGSAISEHVEPIGIEITRAAFSMLSPKRQSGISSRDFEFDRSIRLLQDRFRNEDIHGHVTKTFLSTLEARTMHYTKQFRKMTTVEISNAQKLWALAHAERDLVLAEWDEIARKIAHIGVIHWRVWRDICYWQEKELTSNDELDSPIMIEERHTLAHGCSAWRSCGPIISEDFQHGPEKSEAFN